MLMQDKHHVCTKMFGGGMGDQIKRYCELLNPEVLCSKPCELEKLVEKFATGVVDTGGAP
jgi:hypothetical protein